MGEVWGVREKNTQIGTTVRAQGCYSQPLSASLLRGGNMCGEDVRAHIHMKSAPNLRCSRAHEATELFPCPVQMSSEPPLLLPTTGECTFLWAESWRAAGSREQRSRGSSSSPAQGS